MADFKCKEPGCGFESTDWPNVALATARGDQHKWEHETGELMQELPEFRADYGVEA